MFSGRCAHTDRISSSLRQTSPVAAYPLISSSRIHPSIAVVPPGASMWPPVCSPACSSRCSSPPAMLPLKAAVPRQAPNQWTQVSSLWRSSILQRPAADGLLTPVLRQPSSRYELNAASRQSSAAYSAGSWRLVKSASDGPGHISQLPRHPHNNFTAPVKPDEKVLEADIRVALDPIELLGLSLETQADEVPDSPTSYSLPKGMLRSETEHSDNVPVEAFLSHKIADAEAFRRVQREWQQEAETATVSPSEQLRADDQSDFDSKDTSQVVSTRSIVAAGAADVIRGEDLDGDEFHTPVVQLRTPVSSSARSPAEHLQFSCVRLDRPLHDNEAACNATSPN